MELNFDNELFDAHRRLIGQHLPSGEAFQGTTFNDLPSLFKAILEKRDTLRLNQRNAVFAQVVECLGEETPSLKAAREEHEAAEDALENVTFVLANLDDLIQREITIPFYEERSVTYVPGTGELFLNPATLPDPSTGVDEETVRRSLQDQVRTLEMRARVEYLRELTAEKDALTRRLQDLSRAVTHEEIISAPQVELLRSVIHGDIAVSEEDLMDVPKLDFGDCAKLTSILRNRFAVLRPIRPLVELEANGVPSETSQMLAILYGCAAEGVTIQNEAMGKMLLDSLKRGVIDPSGPKTLGDKYLNSTLHKEIRNMNKIIAAGYHPGRWCEAFVIPKSGMVDLMLNEWEIGGYASLTLGVLHHLFSPRVGSKSILTVIIAEERPDTREDKLVALFKDIISSSNKQEQEVMAAGGK
jgi:hypothetical protein